MLRHSVLRHRHTPDSAFESAQVVKLRIIQMRLIAQNPCVPGISEPLTYPDFIFRQTITPANPDPNKRMVLGSGTGIKLKLEMVVVAAPKMESIE